MKMPGPDNSRSEAAETRPNRSTVGRRVRMRCVKEGVEASLRPRPSRQLHPRKLDGVQEAHLVALACSPAPKDRNRWSLRLLPGKLVELEIVDDISNETVRQTWLKQQYCLPKAPSGEFVYHMEDVLDVYVQPYDSRRPVVCLDETSVQLVAETRTPLPTAPGQPARYDYEYERHGVAAVFMITEPLRGWREGWSSAISVRRSTSCTSSSTWSMWPGRRFCYDDRVTSNQLSHIGEWDS